MKIMRNIVFLLIIPVTISAVDIYKKGVITHMNEYTADSLLNEADTIFQSRDYQAALEKYKTVAEKAREEFNRSVEVEALAQIARMNLLLDRRDEGLGALKKAGERASTSDPMGWSRYLGVKGRFEWQDGDLKAARQTFDDMYVFCQTNGLYSRAVDAAHMIAIVAESPDEQIEWGRRGIEAAEAGDYENWLGPLWNNLAATYYDIERYDSALECYLKAREYHWRFSGETAKLFADYHVGMTYRYLGQFDEAGRWLRPVLAWAERIENHGAMGQALEDLGEIDIARGRKADGLAMLKRAREEYKKEGYDKSWPEIWDGINKRIAELGK
ncbi:MAG: tetratricopeptide repeat protein [Candidatus Zixiibacteriota bacterium]